MAPALAIFDCDGVLVDSEPIANRVLARRLSEAGLPTSYDESITSYLGLSLKAALAKAEALHGTSLTPDFAETLQAETFAAFETDLTPVAGVIGALDALPCPTCVASSGAHDKMRLTLGITGLYARFEGRIFSATEVARGKPFPDLFLHAAERMAVAPGDCVVIEDSPFGVQAAIAAGMRVLGYVGGATAQPLAAHGATEFADMAELPGLLTAV
ncbi:MAG: HAD family hydrolase [Alphaproteobacteria bacterium]